MVDKILNIFLSLSNTAYVFTREQYIPPLPPAFTLPWFFSRGQASGVGPQEECTASPTGCIGSMDVLPLPTGRSQRVPHLARGGLADHPSTVRIFSIW